MIRFLCILSFVLPFLAVASPSLAQDGFLLDRYMSPGSPDDGAVVQMPNTIPQGEVAARLVFNYTHDPLLIVLRSDRGVEVDTIVSNRISAHLAASVGLHDRISFVMELPFTLWQTGEATAPNRIFTPDTWDLRTGGVNDVVLGAQAHLVGGDTGFQLGVAAKLVLPTGRPIVLQGDGRVGARLIGRVGYDSGSFAVGLHLGVALRPEQTYFSYQTGTDAFFALGVFGRVSEHVRLGGEIFGATGLSKRADGTSRFATLDDSPLEGMVSGWFYPGGEDSMFYLGVTAGLGINRAIGVPTIRGQLSLGFNSAPTSSQDRASE